jgi:transcriptional regulator with XRE-family HTH domain
MIDKFLIMTIGQQIKYLRKQNHLSQDKLALLADIPQQKLSLIERDKLNVTLKTLTKVAEVLKVQVQLV